MIGIFSVSEAISYCGGGALVTNGGDMIRHGGLLYLDSQCLESLKRYSIADKDMFALPF